MKVDKYPIIALLNSINWVDFFESYGFDGKFASIAKVEGCDVMRADWLTDFDEKDRIRASQAMQLLKEAYRMLTLLDRDYSILCQEITDNHYKSLIITANSEVELLFEKDEEKRLLVKTLSRILTNAVISHLNLKLIKSEPLNRLTQQEITQISTLFDFEALELYNDKGELEIPDFTEFVIARR